MESHMNGDDAPPTPRAHIQPAVVERIAIGLVEAMVACSPRELQNLGTAARDGSLVADAHDRAALKSFWARLAIVADSVLGQHPDAINLDDVADTPEPTG